jgi:hypothetical protein
VSPSHVEACKRVLVRRVTFNSPRPLVRQLCSFACAWVCKHAIALDALVHVSDGARSWCPLRAPLFVRRPSFFPSWVGAVPDDDPHGFRSQRPQPVAAGTAPAAVHGPGLVRPHTTTGSRRPAGPTAGGVGVVAAAAAPAAALMARPGSTAGVRAMMPAATAAAALGAAGVSPTRPLTAPHRLHAHGKVRGGGVGWGHSWGGRKAERRVSPLTLAPVGMPLL